MIYGEFSLATFFFKWNVHSMVDTEGSVEIASSRGDRGEDRNVDVMVM